MARLTAGRALFGARVLLSLAGCVVLVLVLLPRDRPRPLPPPLAPPPAPARAWPTPFSVDLRDLPSPADLPPGTTRILVLGDSVARFLGLALRYRQEEAQAFVAARGVGSCSLFAVGTRPVDAEPPVETSCSARWVEDVDALRPDVTLVLMGGGFLGRRTCDATWLAHYEARLLDLVAAMGARAGRVVVARVPYPMGEWRFDEMLDRVDCFDGMLVRTAEEARVDVLDLMRHVCPTRACGVEGPGPPPRPDGLHFDGVGAEETARWALGEMRRMAGR